MRLLCFGDSFAATGFLNPEEIAAGRPASWMDLLADRLNAELIINGISGTGPLELIHHLSTWHDFRDTDIVITIFSRPSRLCLTPSSPGLSTFAPDSNIESLDYDAIQNDIFKDRSVPYVKRVFQTHRWHQLYLDTPYRSEVIHRTALLALDSIAQRNPSKFFMKYSFDSEVSNHNHMGIEPKFFKYLTGSCFSMSGEEFTGQRITNHFVAQRVEPFVDYMYENITKEIKE